MNGIPRLPICPTDSREWYLFPKASAVNDAGQPTESKALEVYPGPFGTSYQRKLFCRRHKDFISSRGDACATCMAGQVPGKMPTVVARTPCRKLADGSFAPGSPCAKARAAREAQLAALKAAPGISNVRPRVDIGGGTP